MSEPTVQDKQQVATAVELDREALTSRLAPLVPGIKMVNGDPVSIAAPGIRQTEDEDGWTGLLADDDPAIRAKRRGLLEHIRAVLELDEHAKQNDQSLADAAQQQATTYRRTLEQAWVAIREQNAKKERAVRWTATTLSNMQSSRDRFRNKIHAIDASARELASDAGREFLGQELSHYVHRPDPRGSRAFLVVCDWAGTPTALKKLARVADEHRCLLISDAPSYRDMEQLRAAGDEGGLLEALAGEEMFHRHTVLLGNQGRVRERFRGEHAEEADDLYVPLSGPWFGMYLDNIAQGKPWKPPVGYQSAIPGIDRVKLDLLVKERDQFDLYLRNRINPAVRLSANSDQVVVYGPDALSKSGEGVQIGVAVVEMILVRYAEWVVNQFGLLNDLEEGEENVKKKLAEFIQRNSGDKRMFRSGSRVEVLANHETKTLEITFDLYFREVAERAMIQLSKPAERDKLGTVTAE